MTVNKLNTLREELRALLGTEAAFSQAGQELALVCIQAIENIKATNSIEAVGAVAFVHKHIVALCTEAETAQSRLQSVLRLAVSLIDTIELQRSAMESHQIRISAPELDQWISGQINDLDPDRI